MVCTGALSSVTTLAQDLCFTSTASSCFPSASGWEAVLSAFGVVVDAVAAGFSATFDGATGFSVGLVTGSAAASRGFGGAASAFGLAAVPEVSRSGAVAGGISVPDAA